MPDSFWNRHSITASQAGLNFWIFLYAPSPPRPSFRKRCCLQNEPPFPGPSPKLPAPASPLNTRSWIIPSIKNSFIWGQRMGRYQGIELGGKNSILVLTWHADLYRNSQCLVRGMYCPSRATLPQHTVKPARANFLETVREADRTLQNLLLPVFT